VFVHVRQFSNLLTNKQKLNTKGHGWNFMVIHSENIIFLREKLSQELDKVSCEAINVICKFIHEEHYQSREEYKKSLVDLKKMIEIYLLNYK
jgi:hypothetical protein